jgi:hypothetical protein
MESPRPADDFIAGGLAALGIEADEAEMGVMKAAHDLFWPEILDLLGRDLGETRPEAGTDLSRSPQ